MILKEIDQRRAFRALSERPIDKEVIDRLLTAATYAPSCANKQPWRFLVLNDEKNLGLVHQQLQGGNYWAKKSPAVIAAITRDDLDAQLPGNRNYALFDTGMACMNLQLQAQKEGLIAHPIAGFNAVELCRSLGIKEDYTLITLIILGYPGPGDNLSENHSQMEKSPRDRKPLSQVVFHGHWKN